MLVQRIGLLSKVSAPDHFRITSRGLTVCEEGEREKARETDASLGNWNDNATELETLCPSVPLG